MINPVRKMLTTTVLTTISTTSFLFVTSTLRRWFSNGVNIFNNRLISAVLIVSSVLIFFGVGYKMFLTQASFSGVLTATISINPLTLEIESPTKVFIGENFKLKALFENKRGIMIENIEARIFLPSGITSHQKELKKLGNLPPQKQKEATWILKGEKEGSHIVLVSGKGTLKDSGDLVEVEKSVKIEVGEQRFLRGEIFSQITKLLDFFIGLW